MVEEAAKHNDMPFFCKPHPFQGRRVWCTKGILRAVLFCVVFLNKEDVQVESGLRSQRMEGADSKKKKIQLN